MTKHIMIDIETLGKNDKAIIVSIGAVEFNPENGELGDEFYTTISPYSCEAWGLKADMSTIIWWMRQSNEARDALFGKDVKWSTLKPALEELSLFIEKIKGSGNIPYIWARDPDFDCKILQSAFGLCNIKLPWTFSKCLSCRTAEYFNPAGYKSVTQDRGVYHHALDDAKYQAKCVSAAHLKSIPEAPEAPETIIPPAAGVNVYEEDITIS